jgi:hypothetical protein
MINQMESFQRVLIAHFVALVKFSHNKSGEREMNTPSIIRWLRGGHVNFVFVRKLCEIIKKGKKFEKSFWRKNV